VSNRPGRTALREALADWRRHATALAVVAAAVGCAVVVGSRIAYYAAALVAFAVWMWWFVLTVVEWVRRADF
jgi:hypothetical protein